MLDILRIPSQLELVQEELREMLPEKPPRSRSRGIDEMLACIHRHVFETGFNVGELRRRCRISDNNQSSHFRLSVGLTPREYIETLRLDAAFLLLRRHPEANILDIGYLVGYEHPQTFYRAFRRRYRCNPGEVRTTPGCSDRSLVASARCPTQKKGEAEPPGRNLKKGYESASASEGRYWARLDTEGHRRR